MSYDDGKLDWCDKLLARCDAAVPPDPEVPEWLAGIWPNGAQIIKCQWKLGYLAAMHDAAEVIDEEEVNITFDVLRGAANARDE
jgi:hypothetical protein